MRSSASACARYGAGSGANDQDDDDGGADGGDGDGSVDFDVVPVFGGSTCSVTEIDVAESFIEIDNGCDEIEIDIGAGAECTIVNTVFFEGIPALNRYGLALLALLMLGVGFVAYRRFA